MALPTEEQVRDALREVDDPEIGINIVDLGLVYGIDISGECVHIKMTMTTPACPLHSYLSAASQEAVRQHFPDVSAVDIELVWDMGPSQNVTGGQATAGMGNGALMDGGTVQSALGWCGPAKRHTPHRWRLDASASHDLCMRPVVHFRG